MDWLSQYAWIGALLFARLGAVMMIAPGFGEQTTPTTLRLAMAVMVTAALAPSLAGRTPALPAGVGGVIQPVLVEVVVGLILGFGARVMMTALAVAGAAVGMGTGLSFAQQLDPIQGQAAAVFSAFFSLLGVVLIMSAGLHRVMLQAAADSYTLFPAGGFPPIGDATQYAIEAVSGSFRLGIQIAAPALIFSLVFNIAMGLVSRLIPQVQVFMTAMPASVMLGLAVTALGLGGGLTVWLGAMGGAMRFPATQ